MKKKYQGFARVKRAQLQALRRDFETLQMKVGEAVTNYCARTIEISNKMRFYGEKMDDGVIVEKILRSLAPKYFMVRRWMMVSLLKKYCVLWHQNLIMLYVQLKNQKT